MASLKHYDWSTKQDPEPQMLNHLLLVSGAGLCMLDTFFFCIFNKQVGVGSMVVAYADKPNWWPKMVLHHIDIDE